MGRNGYFCLKLWSFGMSLVVWDENFRAVAAWDEPARPEFNVRTIENGEIEWHGGYNDEGKAAKLFNQEKSRIYDLILRGECAPCTIQLVDSENNVIEEEFLDGKRAA
jgi:hypothetical protein